jgi:hypothetical protein
MSKPPKNWPAAALPARMNEAFAAYFLGIGVTMFRAGVKAGRYPGPVRDRARKLWKTADLQAAVDAEGGQPQHGALDDWIDRLGEHQAHGRHAPQRN